MASASATRYAADVNALTQTRVARINSSTQMRVARVQASTNLQTSKIKSATDLITSARTSAATRYAADKRTYGTVYSANKSAQSAMQVQKSRNRNTTINTLIKSAADIHNTNTRNATGLITKFGGLLSFGR